MAVDPNENEDLQRLYLLEFLVDCIKYENKKIDLSKSFINSLRQTCIRFKFLNFPTIEVCEEDFCPTRDDYRGTDVVFKNGKSCFFSLSRLPLRIGSLELGVTIIRKQATTSHVIGSTCITLEQGFIDVINSNTLNAEKGEATKSLRDVFPIYDDKGIKIGTITLFVRLSCFGKAVITQFKIPLEDGNKYLFANTNEDVKAFQHNTQVNSTPQQYGDSSQTNINYHNQWNQPSQKLQSSREGEPKTFIKRQQDGVPDIVYRKPSNEISGDTSGLNRPAAENCGETGFTMIPGSAPLMYGRDVPANGAIVSPDAYPNRVTSDAVGATKPSTFSGSVPGMYQKHDAMAKPAPEFFLTEKTTLPSVPGNDPVILQQETLRDFSGLQGYEHKQYAMYPPLSSTVPDMGIGQQMNSINPHSRTNFTNPLESGKENRINRQYQNLSVSINGQEFSLKVLRKSREKKVETPKLQVCGRVSGGETSSDSDEITEDASEAGEFETKMHDEIDIQNENIPQHEFVYPKDPKPVKIKTSKHKISLPSLEVQKKTKSGNVLFSLCECDVPLPKGFKIPESEGVLQNDNTAVKKQPSSVKTPIAQAQSSDGTLRIPKVSNSESSGHFSYLTPASQQFYPKVSAASISTYQKRKVDKEGNNPETVLKTYCLKQDCPMGYPWPPNVPREVKIIRVPCCAQLPMHPGSVGFKKDQVVMQMTNGLMSNYFGSFGEGNCIQTDQKDIPFALKLGGRNTTKSNCIKMSVEFPVPKPLTKQLKTDDIDTQYVESDFFVSKKETKRELKKELPKGKKKKKVKKLNKRNKK